MEWATLLQPIRLRKNSSMSKMSNDGRSEFKKDFDTVCNCPSLRRLQDKAQVFPLEREDHARTRLTHSMEVMSIAESLGVEAVSVIRTQDTLSTTTLDLVAEIPTILRVAALIHDMGNPPFGHLGEEIIADWFKENLPKLKFLNEGELIFTDASLRGDEMVENLLNEQMKKDFLYFEGNSQLLRLVTKLSNVVDESGMNLTYPVLATIIKYPTKSTEIVPNKGVECKKMGYLYSENSLFSEINEVLGLNGKRHPLVYLLEAADDIAYLTADIEDANKKGIVTLSTFLNVMKLYENDPFIESILNEYDKYEQQWKDKPVAEHDTTIMQRLRIFMKGKMISAIKETFAQYYKEILAGTFESELLTVSPAATLVSVIRNKIEKEYIYYSGKIVKTKLQGYQILDTLLNKFIPSVFNSKLVGSADDKDTLIYSLISYNYRYVCETKCKGRQYNDPESIYARLRLVTDFISGMTDRYAMNMYQTLMAVKNI